MSSSTSSSPATHLSVVPRQQQQHWPDQRVICPSSSQCVSHVPPPPYRQHATDHFCPSGSSRSSAGGGGPASWSECSSLQSSTGQSKAHHYQQGQLQMGDHGGQHHPHLRSSWANLVDICSEGKASSTPTHRPDCPPGCGYAFAVPSSRSSTIKMALPLSRQLTMSSGCGSSSRPSPSAAAHHLLINSSHFSARPLPLKSVPPATGRLSALSGSSQSAVGGQSASSGGGRPAAVRRQTKKRDRMQELRELWARPACKLCCLVAVLALVALVTVAVLVVNSVLPKHVEFSWFAPEHMRSGQSVVNQGRLDVGELGQQVRIQLSGALPFKSNFISVLDFGTNQLATVDLSLRSGGRNLVCFVMDLDRQNVPDKDALLRAASVGSDRRNQLHGWEESWTWQPVPLSHSPAFQPRVAECEGARWVQLSRTGTDQKGEETMGIENK